MITTQQIQTSHESSYRKKDSEIQSSSLASGGHIAEVLKEYGYQVQSADIIDRGYEGTVIKNIFDYSYNDLDVVTNPPYKIVNHYVKHLLDISKKGTKIALLLKLTFLETKFRRELFKDHPPKTIYVSSSRIRCYKNGVVEDTTNSAIAYAWFVWEIGFKGDPVIKWIN